jgi:hypothetical protein
VNATALDDLRVLYDATWNARDRARIQALIDTLQHRQRTQGAVLDSTYTPALKRALKRERARQKGTAA